MQRRTIGSGSHRHIAMLLSVRAWICLGMQRGKDFILAKKTGEGRHSREGQRTDQECGRRDRHHLPQATEPAHVDHATHGMHHRSGPEEEQRLEEGMRHEVEDRRREAEHRARSKAGEHVAELADCRIGEHPFEVVLHRGDQSRHERCGGPHDRHHRKCPGAGDKQGGAAGDQIDACSHHRGGVDQGAGRGRTLHRVGQPDMQRHLGAFAAGCQQQQQADRRADDAADNPARVGQPGLAQNALDG